MAQAAKIMTELELFGLMEKMNINASNVGKIDVKTGEAVEVSVKVLEDGAKEVHD